VIVGFQHLIPHKRSRPGAMSPWGPDQPRDRSHGAMSARWRRCPDCAVSACTPRGRIPFRQRANALVADGAVAGQGSCGGGLLFTGVNSGHKAVMVADLSLFGQIEAGRGCPAWQKARGWGMCLEQSEVKPCIETPALSR